MNFLKGFFGFYKFLLDIDTTFIEQVGKMFSLGTFVGLMILFFDYVGILILGGK